MKELVERLKKIHNTTDNIGWGVCEYRPHMKIDTEDIDSQYVIVVGHNVYRKTYTLFLEKLNDGVFRLFLINHSKIDKTITLTNDRGTVVCEVIKQLKQWFPEIRK